VHLQGADGGDEDNAVRGLTGVAAFDVEKFLHADVGPEAGLGDNVITKAEGDTISENGGVAMSNVGEWASVDEGGLSFEGPANMNNAVLDQGA
jgi:hypothetical protein